MTVLIALLLGLVQGLCEFLPVSSSGHLMLVAKLTQGAVGEGYFGSFFTVISRCSRSCVTRSRS